MSINKETLTKRLETIFTIDGFGRPIKCKLFLKLMSESNLQELINEIKNISERKNF